MSAPTQKAIPGVQLLSLIAMVFLCIIPFYLLCYFLVPAVSGYSFTSFSEAKSYSDTNYINGIIAMQICYHSLVFILPSLLYYKYFYAPNAQAFGLAMPPHKMHFVYAIVLFTSAIGFSGLLGVWNKLIPMPKAWLAAEDMATEITKSILNIKSFGRFVLTIFYIAILPGLGEELLFRGCIQRIFILLFKNKNVWLAILITSIAFGVMHGQMVSVLPRIFLGVLLGYLSYYSGSLWPGIVAHIFNNGLQVFLSYAFNAGYIKTNITDQETVSTLAGFISLAIVALLAYIIYKNKVAKNYNYEMEEYLHH
jgi:uncharacterized protein